MWLGMHWIFLSSCLMALLAVPASASTMAEKKTDEQLRKELEPLMRDLNKEIEQRVKALEGQAQLQGTSGTPTPPTAGSKFELTVSHGVPERGLLDKYAPIIVPALVSLLTILFSFATQVKLQRASQAHQANLQGMTEKQQQKLQEISAENMNRLQREARWGTRQLEAAQEVWGFLVQTTVAYQLDARSVELTDPISVFPLAVRSQSQREISELIRKHGFFLPKGSDTVLLEVQREIGMADVALATMKENLEKIREGMRVEFSVKGKEFAGTT